MKWSWASQVALVIKNPSEMQEMQETQVQSLGQEDPLEWEVAADSGNLAWKILWTEELDGLQSMGSQRVRQLSTMKWTHSTVLLQSRSLVHSKRSCSRRKL